MRQVTRSTGKRRRSYHFGHVAEFACIALLYLKGYSVLARRHRNHHGEIDIIALAGSTLVFIEVKARAKPADALHSITPQKQRRLMQAALGYLAVHTQYAQHALRFDVMVVTSRLRIHHLKNAWRTE